MRQRVGGIVLTVAFTLGGCGGSFVDDPPSPAASGDNTVGEILPGAAPKLRSTLGSLRGKPVVVNYWATWCAPCKAEMPRIVDASKEYAGRVHFLGVNVEDDIGAAEKFARDYEMTFRSIADPDGDVRRAEKILGLPVTQFYSADGKLAFVHQGEIETDDLEKKIGDVLEASD